MDVTNALMASQLIAITNMSQTLINQTIKNHGASLAISHPPALSHFYREKYGLLEHQRLCS